MIKKLIAKFSILAPKTEAEREARKDAITRVTLKTAVLLNVALLILGFWGHEAAFFWTLFLAFLFFGWDSRYVGALAILALTACPILLSLEYKADAEVVAVWAYYFLVITVVLQIIEFRREDRVKKRLVQRTLDLRSTYKT